MKKVILYILLISLFAFLLPVIFTKSEKTISFAFENSIVPNEKEDLDEENNNESDNENIENNDIKSDYEYSKYEKIKLYHSNTDTVEEIDIDEYLLGVVSAEMPVDFDIEALKAQAVVARTYTIYTIENNKGKHGDADICDSSTCCQAWITEEYRKSRWEEEMADDNWEKIKEAVYSTKGEVIMYDGKPINAFFHSNSGGTTEVPKEVWGGTGYPYLQVVETSGEENYDGYATEVIITKGQLEEKIKNKYDYFEINWDEEKPIEIVEYTDSGRVRTVKIGNVNLSGVEARSIFGLRSANFNVDIDDKNVIFDVCGYGHGVGLSQTGSDSLAKSGYNYKEIISHFYQDVEIINI